MINKIPESDARWSSDEFIKYFSQMGNIEDYLRFVKKEVINSTSSLASLHDEFFNEDIHPEDMEFDIKFVGSRFPQSIPQEHYVNLLKLYLLTIMNPIFLDGNCVDDL